jgi:hypothetical protein
MLTRIALIVVIGGVATIAYVIWGILQTGGP